MRCLTAAEAALSLFLPGLKTRGFQALSSLLEFEVGDIQFEKIVERLGDPIWKLEPWCTDEARGRLEPQWSDPDLGLSRC